MLLKEHEWPLTINFVMYPPAIEHFERLQARFDAIGVRPHPKPFKGKYKGKRYPEAYTEKERELIKRYAPRTTHSDGIPNYFGRRCNAGHKLIRVLEDGTVTRCVTDTEYLGNIYTGFSLHPDPQPCRVKRCPCFSPDLLFAGIVEQPVQLDLGARGRLGKDYHRQ
jgi:hypothetical protein